MIHYYYKNGERVSAEEYISSAAQTDAARKNKPVIEKFETELWERAKEYYDRHPKEREELQSYQLRCSWAPSTAEAYAKTEEGEAFSKEFFKKNRLVTPHQMIGRTFWFYTAWMLFLIGLLVYTIVAG